MRDVIASIEREYRRHERLGDGVLDQVHEEGLRWSPGASSNSLATIVWHVSGNLASRFTDFLTSDGEKEWRDREGEFATRDASATEIRARWASGWEVLFDALSSLRDTDLAKSVTIRGRPLTVADALARSLAHTAYHVGQMTYVGKMLLGTEWSYLSIPPGGTAAYDRNPDRELGPAGSG